MSSRSNHKKGVHGRSILQTQPNDTIEDLLPRILEGLPVGVVLLHLEDPADFKSLKIASLSTAAAEAMGTTIEELQDRTLSDFPKLLETQFPRLCLRVFRTGRPEDLGEVSYGDERIRQGLYSVRLFAVSGAYLGLAIADVTDRRRSEHALSESQERFRLLVEGIQEYAIFQLDPFGHVTSWNAGAKRLKGYTAEEIIGKHFSAFYPPDDVQSGKPERMLEVAAKEGQSKDEGWRVRKDGSRFWASVVITALRDSEGNLKGFAKLTRDVSDRREKEEELRKAKEELERRVEQRTAVLTKLNQELRVEIYERARVEEELKKSLELLRALAARLQHVREEERLVMAREIHDELGQACTALKMDLVLIGRKATKRQEPLRAKAASAVKLVDSMIITLRRIASELRPRALDDLGLSAALEWQAQEFEKRTRIPCQLTLPPETLTLDPDKSIAIFRIFQEFLTNVARHAHATTVAARLEWEGDHLIFQVHDDGKGFDPEAAGARKSLGLLGMRERALLLNGELQLQSAPGAGTTMTLRIPLARSGIRSEKSR
jgi:PAS domain S-box-containing protein